MLTRSCKHLFSDEELVILKKGVRNLLSSKGVDAILAQSPMPVRSAREFKFALQFMSKPIRQPMGYFDNILCHGKQLVQAGETVESLAAANAAPGVFRAFLYGMVYHAWQATTMLSARQSLFEAALRDEKAAAVFLRLYDKHQVSQALEVNISPEQKQLEEMSVEEIERQLLEIANGQRQISTESDRSKRAAIETTLADQKGKN